MEIYEKSKSMCSPLIFYFALKLTIYKRQERQKYGKGEWTEQQEYHLRDLIQKARNGLAWITVKTK